MDVLAHALWAGAGTMAAAPRWRISRKTGAALVALAVLPDVVQSLPVALWAITSGQGWAAWLTYTTALPGHEPALPAAVMAITHHLHCTLHSAVVASAVTALLWAWRRGFWLPLAGWWSHIVIDVFTHSADYYAVPVLYPFTYAGFDGIAWTTPWFMALNYGLLLVVYATLLTRRVGKR